jgi:glycosyltransferase involved in cell wall biosynthesis
MNAQRIIELLLAGEVDRAVTLSRRYFESIHSLIPVDVMYFEPRMQVGAGHFGRLAAAYSAVLAEAGLVTAVLHRHEKLAGGYDRWQGVFPAPDHVVGFGEIKTPRHLAVFAAYFERIFGDCLSGSEARIAIFATSRFLTMSGAVRAVEQARGVEGAIFGVMETYPVPDCKDRDLVENAFREAAELIGRGTKSYLIFAESIPIRDFLIECGVSSKRVFVNPYPTAHRFPDPRNRTARNRRPHIGDLAGMREVQNPGLTAAYLLDSEHPKVDWTIRLNLDLAASHCGMGVPDLRRALLGKGINLIEGRISDAEYDRVLQSLDVVLLPYGERYRTIGSGIFLESLCAGVIPLVHEDSTMRRLYLDLGGRAPGIAVCSVQGIENALRMTLQHLEDLQRNMLAVRGAWLMHDQGPMAWSRRVLDFAGAGELAG